MRSCWRTQHWPVYGHLAFEANWKGSSCLMSWPEIKKKIIILKGCLLLFYATTINYFLTELWCATNSRFYMTTRDDQHSGWTEKKLQSSFQSQSCTKKLKWHPIWGSVEKITSSKRCSYILTATLLRFSVFSQPSFDIPSVGVTYSTVWAEVKAGEGGVGASPLRGQGSCRQEHGHVFFHTQNSLPLLITQKSVERHSYSLFLFLVSRTWQNRYYFKWDNPHGLPDKHSVLSSSTEINIGFCASQTWSVSYLASSM